MKKLIYSIAFLSVVLLSAASCQKEEAAEAPEAFGPQVVLTAEAEAPKTKTTMVEGTDGAHSTWLSTDKIDISDGTTKYVMKINSEDNGKPTAGFAWSSSDNNDDIASLDLANMTFALYPHRQETGAASIKYIASHNANAANKMYAPMIAVLDTPVKGEDGSYDFGTTAFKHAGGFVKVGLLNLPAGVKTIVFTALDDVNITGTVTLAHANLTKDNLVEKIEDGSWLAEGQTWAGGSEVTFNLDAETALGDNQNIYVPVPAGTTFTTSGFKVDVKDAAGTVLVTKTYPFADPYTVSRARMLRGVNLDCGNLPTTVNVKMSSDELSAYAPTKVMIHTDADGKDAANASLLSIEASSRFQTTAEQTHSLTVLPSDYNDKDFWVVVELKTNEGHRIWIPTKHEACTFAQGGTVDVDLTGLNHGMNDASDWYVSNDPRLVTSYEGSMYGAANTYFIQCKNAEEKTYTGGTYAENPNVPNEVVIDYRARGNYFKAVKPEGVTFDWYRLRKGGVYTVRNDKWSATGADPTKYTITHDAANYQVKVKNDDAYAGAPILVMKQGGKTLWAWSFWNIAADGTSIEPITVGSYKFAPMDIGQPTTNATAWIKATEESTLDPIYRMTHYYQWGRHIPIFWNSFWSLDIKGETLDQTGNVPALPSPMTFEKSLENPVGLIITETLDASDADWCSDAPTDLWGSSNVNNDGYKTIYDPCPEGWRVLSGPAANVLVSNFGSYDATAAGSHNLKLGDLVLYLSGIVKPKLAWSSNQYVTNVEKLGQDGISTLGYWWRNTKGGNQANNVRYNGSEFGVGQMNRNVANAVRCMKDGE